jgi:5-hydroxyisourate hydrolase
MEALLRRIEDLTQGTLTTHVLDIMHGCPAANMQIQVRHFNNTDAQWQLIATVYTMHNGRTMEPVLIGETFIPGRYELTFMVSAYFNAYFKERGVTLPDPPFLDDVPIRFNIANTTEHYHVPLLVSPWAYSTYRGS